MGKDTDKLYITHSEWATLDFGAGGFKDRRGVGAGFKRLPFHWCVISRVQLRSSLILRSCALSLRPFESPRCTRDGHVFDLMSILPWIKKHGTNPVTGAPLAASDLITLHFHKNRDGRYHDPITFKVFSDNTHIVACPSGHVFAWETIDELCVKTKSWRDLITDEPFKRKDIITIQDPHNITSQNINAFHYKVNDIARPEDPNETPESRKKREIESNINTKGTTSRILADLAPKSSSSPITPSYVSTEKKAYNTAHFSDNAASASFTSLGATAVTKNKAVLLSDDDYLIAHVNERASARLNTSLGTMDVELFCDVAPKACFNFIKLATSGYYKNVLFHRLIRNFMVQTGDPDGTGRGGTSYFGHVFSDEFRNLSHDQPGILSMANKGPNTNGSQLTFSFITFKQCKHLDGKHTIFGKVTSGIEVLNIFEQAEVNADDKPKKPIYLESIEVLFDPFEKALNVLKGVDPETAKKVQATAARKARQEVEDRIFAARPVSSGTSDVAKYLKKDTDTRETPGDLKRQLSDSGVSAERPKKKSAAFDFSSW
ncbi:Peptidyl-prolyl cis-trans isomerase cyp8 [Entophlyctis luteolus]|nr:Peptidyl-prolyl cis-trans isomerase cyp8 [Entophlyctis luteolus]KAJ3347679.1 Peptidyl-prolyl cis-trans isomerase cyp8 [Entophlyctis luteolus]KAJ3380555.1 Peptidyl-prolyl cis-trans isomerase cyp8 [Entophlyctis sp. JEL0112]